MSSTEIFFKEFIESKKFSKLKSVNHILNSTSVFSITPELPQIINFLKQFYKDGWFTVDTNVTMMNKKSEYLLNQQYTLNIGEVLSFYEHWSRDKKLENILD
jgi:hypothetical protein